MSDLRDMVDAKQSELDAIKSSLKRTQISDLMAEKEEYYAEVLRLQKIVQSKSAQLDAVARQQQQSSSRTLVSVAPSSRASLRPHELMGGGAGSAGLESRSLGVGAAGGKRGSRRRPASAGGAGRAKPVNHVELAVEWPSPPVHEEGVAASAVSLADRDFIVLEPTLASVVATSVPVDSDGRVYGLDGGGKEYEADGFDHYISQRKLVQEPMIGEASSRQQNHKYEQPEEEHSVKEEARTVEETVIDISDDESMGGRPADGEDLEPLRLVQEEQSVEEEEEAMVDTVPPLHQIVTRTGSRSGDRSVDNGVRGPSGQTLRHMNSDVVSSVPSDDDFQNYLDNLDDDDNAYDEDFS